MLFELDIAVLKICYMDRINEFCARLMKLDNLIQLQKTGSAKELAHKLGVSRSQLFNYLEQLREMGVEIAYQKSIASYCYQGELELKIQQPFKVISRKELEDDINGGQLFKESKFTGLLHVIFV